MNPNKVLWEKGDFTEIAALMDPQRYNLVRVTASEDKLIVYASTTRRIHQSNDVGCEYLRHRAFWEGRGAQGKDIHGQGYIGQ